MAKPEKQGKGLRDQIERDPSALSERVAVLQDRVKALGNVATFSELDQKAFMDDLWGEDGDCDKG